MSGKIKLMSLVGVLIFGMSAMAVQNDKLFEITKNIELFVNVYKTLNKDFVDELDPGELMGRGIDAMVDGLDPYTRYISESKIESYRLSDLGKYQGMGAIIEVVDDYVTILEPYQDGPAMNAGLRAGDQIIAINGQSTKGKSSEEVNAISMGAPGTAMSLTVKRVGEKKELAVELIRGETNIPNVPYSGRVADNIGYINLTTFTQNASGNITKALKELKTEGNLDGVVLDLRFNGGGLLAEAIDICNIFVPKDVEVVTTKGKVKERDQSYKTRRPTIDPEIPLVVLINGKSASASEIVSGVMQDLDRGVLIGQRSFGKGLVQNTPDIGYNSKLKLTTAKYYIPSRRCIQAVEYKDGLPVDIPDDRRSKFKTKNGRTVLDGGGVTPDIKMPKPQLSEYTEWLKSENLIFKFVTEYVLDVDSIAAPGDYEFADYQQFKQYVAANGGAFVSQAEKDAKELQEKHKTSKVLSAELANIVQTAKASHTDDINTYMDEIRKEIELEIVGRYYYQGGKAKHRLNGDPEIQEAIAVLNDVSRYKKILQ